jgi:hypothetical protein
MENFEEIPVVTKGPYDREGLIESHSPKKWDKDRGTTELTENTH